MNEIRTELRSRTVCPNCWAEFMVDQVKWIAAHDSLVGDYRLGNESQLRFLPTRFGINGTAIDRLGMECRELACPSCHVRLPRSVLVHRPFFVSIAGSPSCGKSFFLASMIWQLRRSLPSEFGVLFKDSDGECNRIVNHYEEQLFFGKNKQALAKLAKTDVSGDWYTTVQFDDQVVTLPKPFYFDLIAENFDACAAEDKRLSRLLCIYDNAGESFLPGGDTVANPVTKHLGLAESWLFCFDPTQDPRFREALQGSTTDFQVVNSPVTTRQDVVLNEMINRVRRTANLKSNEKSKKPLIIACTKFDAWASLVKWGKLPKWKRPPANSHRAQIDFPAIQTVSNELRRVLEQYCPEVVSLGRALTDKVLFVPVSATGQPPEKDPSTGDYMVRTATIKPIWCEVPMMLSLYLSGTGLVAGPTGESTASQIAEPVSGGSTP